MKVLAALILPWLAVASCLAAPGPAEPASSAPPAKSAPLLQSVLRTLGILAAPAQRGDEPVAAGSVWVATLAQDKPVRWTAAGGFRSPVAAAGDGPVYALRGDVLVRIDGPGAAPLEVGTVPGVDRLLGVQADAPASLLVLTTEARSPFALLAVDTGRRTALPLEGGDLDAPALAARARSPGRAVGPLSVEVERQTRQGLARTLQWTDVILRDAPNVVRNLSACNGVDCGQPALSPDQSRVTFVRRE